MLRNEIKDMLIGGITMIFIIGFCGIALNVQSYSLDKVDNMNKYVSSVDRSYLIEKAEQYNYKYMSGSAVISMIVEYANEPIAVNVEGIGQIYHSSYEKNGDLLLSPDYVEFDESKRELIDLRSRYYVEFTYDSYGIPMKIDIEKGV